MYASSGTVMQKAKVTGEQVMSLLAPHRPVSDPQESDRGRDFTLGFYSRTHPRLTVHDCLCSSMNHFIRVRRGSRTKHDQIN